MKLLKNNGQYAIFDDKQGKFVPVTRANVATALNHRDRDPQRRATKAQLLAGSTFTNGVAEKRG